MKGRKRERFKSILLVCLVFSSLLLSYSIITYKPDYELLLGEVNKNYQKLIKTIWLVFNSGYYGKTYPGMREEAIVPNSITKVATVEAVKDKRS